MLRLNLEQSLISVLTLTDMQESKKHPFDAYNESGWLKNAVERFRERTGHYPERVLADQIYRTRENRRFCKENGIRLSGPKLGRPNPTINKADKKLEYQDNTDRIAVELEFSREKRCYGLGRIVTRLWIFRLDRVLPQFLVLN